MRSGVGAVDIFDGAEAFEARLRSINKKLEINVADETILRQSQEDNRRRLAGEALWLYEKVDEFGCMPEQLCEVTGRGASQVQQAITFLELQGLIKRDANYKIIKT